ncbi:MAG: NAD-dependent malic enzyme [Fimbriimonadia bacterium]|jgi:malate dehydrogenase (oxaloacetate-decarboxylating)
MPACSPSFSLTVRLRIPNVPGMFARIAEAIGGSGAALGSIDLVSANHTHKVRDVDILASSEEHQYQILEAIAGVGGVEVLEVHDRTTQVHVGGKLEEHPRYACKTYDDLSMLYTPGVARICKMIKDNSALARRYTIRGNTVAIVTDGSAVLGLGNIGPISALPVMEGKAVLFKQFANVDAFPICLDTQDVNEIVETVERIAPVFGGINLEDISGPRCFDVEERLAERLDIPVFHDDQHGTAVVVVAALINALKLLRSRAEDLRVVVAGAGAAGTAVSALLLEVGVRDLTVVDVTGILHPDDMQGAHPKRRWLAQVTNPRRLRGSLEDAVRGANMFVGVAAPNILSLDALRTMAPDPIIFAMANPDPEILPELAQQYAAIVATGRSDYPNQINNVLCFPGFFRGLLDCGAQRVTLKMKLAAAHAIASVVSDEQLSEDFIVPSVFNPMVAEAVANAVSANCGSYRRL